MKRIVFLAAALAAAAGGVGADPVFKPPKAKDGHSYPDCYCTNRGVRVEIGEMSCLQIGSQEFTARCGMSLNNPAWRDKTPGCDKPISQAPEGSEFLEPT